MGDPASGGPRSSDVTLVVTTFASSEVAERVVRTLLDEHLVACGNIVPGILSLYWWEGEITREGEVLVLLKVGASSVEPLFQRLAELHPYAVPELLELPVARVSGAYRQWVIESTRVGA